MRYSKLFASLIVFLSATMISIGAEANSAHEAAFDNYYGGPYENIFPDSTYPCGTLCHVTAAGRKSKNWYGDCLDYRSSPIYKGGLGMTQDEAVAACDALDCDGDGWTTAEEVFGNQGLGYPTLPGNNFAVAQGLMPNGTSGESSSPPPTLSAIFNDIDYGVIPPYTQSQGNGGMDDQPRFGEWEIDEAGQGFSNGTGLLQQSGPIDIYNPAYSNTPANNTFIWTPGLLMDNMVYSWRVRFMDGNAAGDTHEWGNWAYASFSTGSCTPPLAASTPSPADASTNQPITSTLSWSGSGSTYDVILEAANPSPTTVVSAGQAATTYNPGALAEGTTYYWKIVSYDAGGTCSISSPVWSFATTIVTCTDGDSDTYAVEGGPCGMIDCDDTDPAVNPGVAEVCGDGVDNNCDTQIDEGCATCTDSDSDTYAVEGGSCGMVDCDDTDPAVNPGAAEVCGDGIDNNCDTQIDEGCDTTPPAVPTGLVAIGGDSQVDLSWNANTEPDLHHYLIYRATTSGGPYDMIAMRMHTHGTTYTDTTVVNGTTYYYVITADDMSGNESGMSAEVSATPTLTCTDGDGDTYAVEGGGCGLVDCDDTDPAVNPGAAEVCGDGIDNNCDTQIDEGCVTCTDADGDGYYAEAGCGTEVDCDDSNPDINPGACDIKRNGIDEDCDGSDRHSGPACTTGDPEICNDGIDNDGDGYIDCLDSDCAGDPACSGCVPSPEICDDGIDNDCDGKADCLDRKDCKNFPGC